ncbi:MAG: hypothetical protein NVSMB1_23410 [Polyangiales bacterium]
MRVPLPCHLALLGGLAGLALSCAPRASSIARSPGAKVACPATSASSPIDASAAPSVDRADPDFPRALALTNTFRFGTPRNAALTADGTSVVYLRSAARSATQVLYEFDIKTGKERTLLSPDKVSTGPESLSVDERARRERMRISGSGFTSFELSDDGARILLTLSGRLLIVDRATAACKAVDTGEGAVLDPRFSRDGLRVAFLRDHELYVMRIGEGDGKDGKPIALTRGGTDSLAHGAAEFVAQEEFDRFRGYWWSPDGSQILYEEVDNSKVEQLSISDPVHPEKPPPRSRYPRAGKTNAKIRFGLVSSTGGPTRWVQGVAESYAYVPCVAWPRMGPPTLYAMDRLQQHAALYALDPSTARVSLLLTEEDKDFLNSDPSMPRWLHDGTFLWSTERSGRWALEVRDATAKSVRTLPTPQGFAYRRLVDLDPEKGVAWIEGGLEPTEASVFRVDVKQGNHDALAPAFRRLTQDSFVLGEASSDRHETFSTYEGSEKGERHYRVRGALDGHVLADIPAVSELPSTLRTVEFATIGDDQVRVAIVRPKTFDKTKRYAVIDAAYGGPHFNTVVKDAFQYARAAFFRSGLDAPLTPIQSGYLPLQRRNWEH